MLKLVSLYLTEHFQPWYQVGQLPVDNVSNLFESNSSLVWTISVFIEVRTSLGEQDNKQIIRTGTCSYNT